MTIRTTVTHITTLPVTVTHVLFTPANQEQSILAEIQGHTVVIPISRGSRPQTPANYPPRQHDRSPIPAAVLHPSATTVLRYLFFIIENASEHEERLPAGPLGHTTEHSPPTIPEDSTSLSGTFTASLRPSFFNSPGKSHSPIAPSSSQPQCPLWMQNTPQLYC